MVDHHSVGLVGVAIFFLWTVPRDVRFVRIGSVTNVTFDLAKFGAGDLSVCTEVVSVSLSREALYAERAVLAYCDCR